MGTVNKKKLHVAVLMGGWSHEHGISIKSGKVVFDNLDNSKYSLRAVIVTPEKKVLGAEVFSVEKCACLGGGVSCQGRQESDPPIYETVPKL